MRGRSVGVTGGMDDVVRIALTTEEKADLGEQLAQLMAQRDALEAQRKEAMDRAKTDIDSLEQRIEEMAEDLREGRIERRQGDLFVDTKLPPAQVTEALRKVATTPLPTETHPFEGKKRGECTVCGAHAEDPIHAEPQTSADGAYAFDGQEPPPHSVPRAHPGVGASRPKGKRGRKAEAGA